MIVCIITYLALFVRIRLYFVLTRETHCELCIVLSVNQSIKFIFQENITKKLKKERDIQQQYIRHFSGGKYKLTEVVYK